MNDDVAPVGGTREYSYINERGQRVDVAARREGQALDSRTLDQLRIERDATVSAGLPTRYNQQTLVGNISGAGNRHVIEDTPSPRRPVNFPILSSEDTTESCTPPGGDTSKIYVRATHFTGGKWVCYWLETTTCS